MDPQVTRPKTNARWRGEEETGSERSATEATLAASSAYVLDCEGLKGTTSAGLATHGPPSLLQKLSCTALHTAEPRSQNSLGASLEVNADRGVVLFPAGGANLTEL